MLAKQPLSRIIKEAARHIADHHHIERRKLLLGGRQARKWSGAFLRKVTVSGEQHDRALHTLLA